jgi:hypothetical protein
MSAAVVDRNSWRWEVRIGERSHGDTHGLVAAHFRVEDIRAAHGAKPEQEFCPLISDPEILGGVAEHLERRRKARKSGEDAASSSLARKAIADADAARLAFDLNAQLSAGA